MSVSDEYGYGSPEGLWRRIDLLRMLMLGAQKELGALAEGAPDPRSQPWPELFDQLADLQASLADLRTELHFYHRTSLGQRPITLCFPPPSAVRGVYLDDVNAERLG